MKILLLNQFYLPDTAATGQLLADLGEDLAGKGHEVHVVCSRRSYQGCEIILPARETINGVIIHRVGATGFGRHRTAGRLLDYATYFLLALLKAFRFKQVDACLLLTTPPLLASIGLLLHRIKKVPYAVWCMDLYPEVAAACGAMNPKGLLYKLLHRINQRIHRRAAFVISLGRVMSKRLEEAGVPREKIVTVANWVPGETVSKPDASEITHPVENEVVTLMYSGNLGAGHDFDTILKALSSLPNDERPHFLLVGSGKLEPAIRQHIVKENLESHIRIESPVPLERLPQSLARGHIHLVTQLPGTEGLIVPSKVYGLLAAGKPILFIGPADCEVADLMRESRAGFVINPGDHEAAARHLGQLCHDPELRIKMGENARSYYRQHLGRDVSLPKLTEIVEKTADQKC